MSFVGDYKRTVCGPSALRFDLPRAPHPAILRPVVVQHYLWKRNGARIGSLLRLAAMVTLCAAVGAGCHSLKGPGHESLAAVVVSGPTPLETAHAVSEVFQQAGYKPVPLPDNKDMRLAFERPAGGMATFLYGDWDPNKVWVRVKVRIAGLDEDKLLVTCDLYRVTDHGDSHFEVEHKMSHVKRRPFRELLDKVKARVTAPAP